MMGGFSWQSLLWGVVELVRYFDSRSVVMKWLLVVVSVLTVSVPTGHSTPNGFSWINPGPQNLISSISKKIRHRTFASWLMGIDVGYYIYLPPGCYQPENSERHYPVVYNLHGGRSGGKYKMISIHRFVDAAIRAGKIEPVIDVFTNGGPMSC